MRRTIVLAALMLVGCSKPITDPYGPAEAYQRGWDAFLEQTWLISSWFARPCRVMIKRPWGLSDEPLPVDRCFNMLPQQRWRGVWIAGGFNSYFLPGETQAPARITDKRIWLTMPTGTPGEELRGLIPGRAYLVDLIGRRTRYAGHYGDDNGSSQHQLFADRILSIRLLEERPKGFDS